MFCPGIVVWNCVSNQIRTIKSRLVIFFYNKKEGLDHQYAWNFKTP